MINKAHQYPIGEFVPPKNITRATIAQGIKVIEEFPLKLGNEIKSLSKNQISKTYRKQGWNGFQVVHHCADSHINGYVRFKLTLTENEPVIKPYTEQKWAELNDAKDEDIMYSVFILKGLHQRWASLMKSMTHKQWELFYIHPENNEKIKLKTAICLYSWHCEHHLAHIKLLKK